MTEDRESQKQRLNILRKEDELWAQLREQEERIYDFITNVIEDDDYSCTDKDSLNTILICLKVCISSSVTSEKNRNPIEYNLSDFIDELYPIYFDNNSFNKNDIEKIRKKIWGYVSFKMPTLLKMASEYIMAEEGTIEVDEEGEYDSGIASGERAKCLFVCVFVSYIEMMLRRMEFSKELDNYED